MDIVNLHRRLRNHALYLFQELAPHLNLFLFVRSLDSIALSIAELAFGN